jgi:hypothetical protein
VLPQAVDATQRELREEVDERLAVPPRLGGLADRQRLGHAEEDQRHDLGGGPHVETQVAPARAGELGHLLQHLGAHLGGGRGRPVDDALLGVQQHHDRVAVLLEQIEHRGEVVAHERLDRELL